MPKFIHCGCVRFDPSKISLYIYEPEEEGGPKIDIYFAGYNIAFIGKEAGDLAELLDTIFQVY